MPIRRQLILMRNVQHSRLGEIVADDLQPDRQLIGKAGRHAHAGQAGEVDGDGIDVFQVHGDRIVGFFTGLEGGAGVLKTCSIEAMHFLGFRA